MVNEREELAVIKSVLKQNPRGLQVIEVARLTGMSRHTTAKYLEMLQVAGQVEMRSFGPAKVYYLSSRVPISAMLDFSSDAIVVLDQRLGVVQVNDPSLLFFGKRREDLLGKQITGLLESVTLRDDLMGLILQAMDGSEVRCETSREREGKEIFLKIRCVPTVFQDGSSGVTVIIEDVTPRKLSEIALRNARDRLEQQVSVRTRELDEIRLTLQKVLDTVPNGVIVADARTGRYSYVSPRCTVMPGLPMTGDTLFDLPEGYDLLTPDGQHFADEARPLIRSIRNGEVVLNTEMILRSAERERNVLFSSAPIFGSDNQIIGAVGALTDITDRKITERRLFESSQMLQAVFRVSPLPVIAVDLEYRVITWNSAAEKLFGWKAEEAMGQVLPTIAPERKAEIAEMHRRVSGGEVIERELVLRRKKDGTEMKMYLSLSPIFNAQMQMIGSMGVMEPLEQAP